MVMHMRMVTIINTLDFVHNRKATFIHVAFLVFTILNNSPLHKENAYLRSMVVLRLLLLPFSLLYGLIVACRNKLFDWGLFKSTAFELPIIVIGNLAVGGSGKSPVTEAIIRLLKADYKVATLSRGYGRHTKGYREVMQESLATEVGDEPLQFKQKFPAITVAVSENRVKGVQQLKNQHDVILLDDAYQHRWLKPGLSILLFDYTTLFTKDYLLPAGRQREHFAQRYRADVLMVTKIPSIFSPIEKRRLEKYLAPLAHQHLFFSSIEYAALRPVFQDTPHESVHAIASTTTILLVTGIANPQPMRAHLERSSKHIEHLQYADHYSFEMKDIEKIATSYKQISNTQKIIITTEKDAMRLKDPKFAAVLNQLPLFILPIEAVICPSDQQKFNALILNYVRKSTKNSSLHPKES